MDKKQKTRNSEQDDEYWAEESNPPTVSDSPHPLLYDSKGDVVDMRRPIGFRPRD